MCFRQCWSGCWLTRCEALGPIIQSFFAKTDDNPVKLCAISEVQFPKAFVTSVARLGDLLDIGKHLAANNLSKSPTFLGNFGKVVKIKIFLMKSILCNFYRHLAIFSGHTVCDLR